MTLCVSIQPDREFDLDHRDESGKKISSKRRGIKGSVPQVGEIAWHLLLLDHGTYDVHKSY